jgi:hypothetical protein
VAFGLSLLLLANPAPTHAVFGFSKCERVEKQIRQEEAIGRELWKNYDAWRDRFSRQFIHKWGEVSEGLTRLSLVHKSDLRVYSLANKNKDCFTTKTIATIREMQLSIREKQENFLSIQKMISAKGYSKVTVEKKWAKAFQIEYPSFVSIYSYSKD